jgi:hypothetical protein
VWRQNVRTSYLIWCPFHPSSFYELVTFGLNNYHSSLVVTSLSFDILHLSFFSIALMGSTYNEDSILGTSN